MYPTPVEYMSLNHNMLHHLWVFYSLAEGMEWMEVEGMEGMEVDLSAQKRIEFVPRHS